MTAAAQIHSQTSDVCPAPRCRKGKSWALPHPRSCLSRCRAALTPRTRRSGAGQRQLPAGPFITQRAGTSPCSPGQGWHRLPRVTVPGRWHTLTRWPPTASARPSLVQILPTACQLPAVLPAPNTSSVLLIPERSASWSNPAFPGASSPGVRPAPRRCSSPALPVNAIFQRSTAIGTGCSPHSNGTVSARTSFLL